MMTDKTIKQTSVMGFSLPRLKSEGRTVCQWDCQYEDLNKRIEALEAALTRIVWAEHNAELSSSTMIEMADIAHAALAGEKKDDLDT